MLTFAGYVKHSYLDIIPMHISTLAVHHVLENYSMELYQMKMIYKKLNCDFSWLQVNNESYIQ